MDSRETTSEKTTSRTYVIIADEEVAAFIEQQGITDTNAYMLNLLKEEMQRQKGLGQKSANASAKK